MESSGSQLLSVRADETSRGDRQIRPVLNYFEELCKAMEVLGQEPNAIFIGQGVGCGGTTMSPTFDKVPKEKRIEFPVAEDMQMGLATGMALGGYLPICIFPRWNFLLLAANQLVNHLDRLPLYSDGGYCPRVIIRTAVPSYHPFNPGPQHDDDFTGAFRAMLRTVDIVTLNLAEAIVPAYETALNSDRSTLLVEFTEHYRDQRAK